MKTYTGAIDSNQPSVTVDGQPIRPVWPGHRRGAPFEWGKQSPGAEHVAEAILLDYAGENPMRVFAHVFMKQVVSELPTTWSFSSEAIQKWLNVQLLIGLSIQKTCSALPGSEEPPPPAEPLRPSDFPTFPKGNTKRFTAMHFDHSSL
jgi:hypothetical protein